MKQAHLRDSTDAYGSQQTVSRFLDREVQQGQQTDCGSDGIAEDEDSS